MPKFCIVIPTRNRCKLLPNSVLSAVQQQHDDFSVVISNNSSEDETAAVGKALAEEHERVSYVETDDVLAMPDSWEFAINQADGEYAIILCDDDALNPRLLSRLDAEIQNTGRPLITWQRYAYCYPNWLESEYRNTLTYRPPSNTAIRRETKSELRGWFDTSAYQKHSPMLFSAVCRQDLIKEIQAEAGRFFIGPAPDVGSSVMLLSKLEDFLFIDEALALAGASPQSIGASQSLGTTEASAAFEAEFKGDIYQQLPFKMNMVNTTVADTLLNAKSLCPEIFADYELNWRAFYRGCYLALLDMKGRGFPVDERLEEVTALASEYPGLKRELGIMAAKRQLKNSERAVKMKLRSLLPGTAPKGRRQMIFGDDAGFSNILECASQLDRLVKYPGAAVS